MIRSRIRFPFRAEITLRISTASLGVAYAKAGETPETRSRMIRMDVISIPHDSIHSFSSRSEQSCGTFVKKSCEGIPTLRSGGTCNAANRAFSPICYSSDSKIEWLHEIERTLSVTRLCRSTQPNVLEEE